MRILRRPALAASWASSPSPQLRIVLISSRGPGRALALSTLAEERSGGDRNAAQHSDDSIHNEQQQTRRPQSPRLPFRFETGIGVFAKRPPRPFPPPFSSRPSASFSDPLSTHRAIVDGEEIRGLTNGDDAVYASDFFICANDGVGAWATRPRGHAGLWARLILHFWASAIEEDLNRVAAGSVDGEMDTEPHPVACLSAAYKKTLEATSAHDWQGTTTACGAQLHFTTPLGGSGPPVPLLYVTNLGDCQIMVVRPRDKSVVFKTCEQWHWFDCPRQLGTNSPDTPEGNAVVDRVELQVGDVVLAMSDGVIDNLWSHEIVEIVTTSIDGWEKAELKTTTATARQRRGRNGGMRKAAQDLVSAARNIASDPYAQSPFMEHAIEEGLASEGENLLDIHQIKTGIFVITAVISRAQLQGVTATGKAVITDVKHLSSYNWIEAPTPTIVVPGMPALWVAPDGPRRLARDSGFFYIAQNAARHPDHPLEPLFRSLYAEDEFCDISSVSVITERNSIRKLLSLIITDPYKSESRAFTIGVEVIKDTVVFRRDETVTHEILGLGNYRGHGHEFEKAYTVNRVDGSTGYHRVISYQFCGLKFLVCHETDAYIDETSDSSEEGTTQELATPLTAYTSINGSKLRIAKGGKMVPLHTVLEIKTRTMRKPLAIRDVAPQLWISQTPNTVRAHHNYGEFDKAQTENVAAQIEEWENENQPALEKLGWLMKQITAIAKDCGGQAKVEYDPQGNRLVVSPDCGKRMLPADLYSKWKIESSYREPETAIPEHGGAEFTAEVKETKN